MALLTAEDVLNKAFSKTKYREGFDQDEVDDFLDEVAHTITSLIAERDDLAARLQAGGGASQGVEAAPLTEAGGVPGTSGLLGAATDPNPPSPAGMLAMAQKLHDEYVNAGEEEKDRIIDEAKTKAESIVEQAQQDAKGRMDDLAAERGDLERKIDDLRRFERDYRARIKTFLENLLGDLDHGTSREAAASPKSSDDAAGAVPAAAGVQWPEGNAADDDASADDAADEANEADATDAPSTEFTPGEAADESDTAAGNDAPQDGGSDAPAVDAPPVRQSFGYQAPAQDSPSDDNGEAKNFANPFAPVTAQQPIVGGGNAPEGNGQEPPRYPTAF
ncbi:DivIVA domain-containing protein [Demequina aurantiaca]|uniref:DivIVA domain-containing protein n=1 Tax=Demequina aurantiaca TaxID=676200 RepID=UPI0007848577|nr:DivIVA domain-containing protein [Demequina aurantiaca]